MWDINVPYEMRINFCCVMTASAATVTLVALVCLCLTRPLITNSVAKLAEKLTLLRIWKVCGSNTASVLPAKHWKSAFS